MATIVMPIPTNMTEIKWFLGVAGFYQCYFWDFTSKVAPMCKLLKKDEKFMWTETCAKSWEWMKHLWHAHLYLLYLIRSWNSMCI